MTARRVRQRIAAVMKWAIAQGFRQDNLAGDVICVALPKTNSVKQHLRALPHSEVLAAITTIRGTDAYRATVLALEFLVLTAARSGEVRLAKWREIDMEAATWTIPAERTKMKREHRVPLSARALAVLGEAQQLRDGTGLVFPLVTGRPLTDSTVSKLVRENRIKAAWLTPNLLTPNTPQGCRKSASLVSAMRLGESSSRRRTVSLNPKR